MEHIKYILRFFTHERKLEKLVKEYTFNYLPYIPRKKEIITIDDINQYIVKKVAVCYDNNEHLIEIMLDNIDYSKEWWE